MSQEIINTVHRMTFWHGGRSASLPNASWNKFLYKNGQLNRDVTVVVAPRGVSQMGEDKQPLYEAFFTDDGTENSTWSLVVKEKEFDEVAYGSEWSLVSGGNREAISFIKSKMIQVENIAREILTRR